MSLQLVQVKIVTMMMMVFFFNLLLIFDLGTKPENSDSRPSSSWLLSLALTSLQMLFFFSVLLSNSPVSLQNNFVFFKAKYSRDETRPYRCFLLFQLFQNSFHFISFQATGKHSPLNTDCKLQHYNKPSNM